MLEANKRVKEYLNYYCTMKNPPEYAVMLKGSWGSGKTRFIKEFIQEIQDDEICFLYVSLYGLRSIDDVRKAIYRNLYPSLSSRPVRFIGGLISGALQHHLGIGGGIDPSEYLINLKDKIIIFDDFERCNADKDDVLGLLNSHVEHLGGKVILIANEEIIFNSEASRPDIELLYSLKKEKLIGKTLSITPDHHEAFDYFLSKIECKCSNEFYSSNKGGILDLFENSKSENLRFLRAALMDFEKIYHYLPEKAQKSNDFLMDLFSFFYVCFSEIRSGDMVKSEIAFLTQVKAYGSIPMGLPGGDEDQTRLRKIADKYNSVDLNVAIFDTECWEAFFDTGFICEKDVAKFVDSSRYFIVDDTPSWKKLWWWPRLTDEQFPVVYGDVLNDFNERNFECLNVLKHVVGAFIRLSEKGIIQIPTADILANSKIYIDHLRLSGKILTMPYSGRRHDFESWDGLGYSAKETKEFQEFADYLEDAIDSAEKSILPDKAQKLLELMVSDVKLFCLEVCDTNTPDRRFYQTPIFKFIDPAKFLSAYEAIPNDLKYWVGETLSERYKMQHYCKKLTDERPWLDLVITAIETRLSEEARPIANFHLQCLLEAFQKAVLVFDENQVGAG